MSKRGLPAEARMRHDAHYVEELSNTHRNFGRMLPLDKIEPNPNQPRTEMGDLTELVDSIREKGVLEPILVKPLPAVDKWLIIAGERRWRAAQLAGLAELPCIELEIDEQQIAEIALIENLQRKDLTVWEEADALAALCRRFGYTHEDVARKLGKSRSTVTESLTVAALPPAVREKCLRAGISTKSAILQVARQFDEQSMLEAVEKHKSHGSPGSQNTAPVKPATGSKPHRLSNGNQTSGITSTSFPVRVFTYLSEEGDFKLELKLKKPADKGSILRILRSVIKHLDEN